MFKDLLTSLTNTVVFTDSVSHYMGSLSVSSVVMTILTFFCWLVLLPLCLLVHFRLSCF